MRLAAFIRAHTEPIMREWENFALTLISQSHSASPLALRDHIEELLVFIADDIQSPQTESEQKQKSHGKKLPDVRSSAAEIHAAVRLSGGFNMDQMVSEYRSLRASVIRLWEAQQNELKGLDLTDLIRFNEAIDQQITESIHHYTKKLDHSRDLFIGILSHDLYNPLGAARMSAELLLRIGNFEARETMLATQIVDSANRALEIVSHLHDLTLARLGSGLPVVRQTMDMGFAARVLVDEARAMHPEHTITIEVIGDTKGEWDKPRIGQVLSNLIGNAIQYGFKDLPIHVTIKDRKNEVILSVHNGGVPIPPETIGRIFDSLTRGVTKKTAAGDSVNLGLGLFITKEIVEAHKGVISVTSTEKDGTMFTARFPRTACSVLSGQTKTNAPLLTLASS